MPENYYDKSRRICNEINELRSNLSDSRLSAEAKNESARVLVRLKKEFERHHGMSYEAMEALANR